MIKKIAWSSIQLVGHMELNLFPFYKPKHKALTGPMLTNSKSQILLRESGPQMAIDWSRCSLTRRGKSLQHSRG